MASWRDADIDRFVSAVVPVVTQGQFQIAQLTDAYLAQVDKHVFGIKKPATTAVRPAQTTVKALRGVDAEEVFRRPAVELYTALTKGKTLDEAVDAGLKRAVGLAVTGLQLAKTSTVQRRLSKDDRIVGYRRVLTGREDCALCAIASTQRYTRGDLMPIHPGCDCDVAPIRGTEDPGRIINADLLEQTHQAVENLAGSADRSARDIGLGTGRDYTHLISTRTHGELGPVLTWRDQHFTGPNGVAG